MADAFPESLLRGVVEHVASQVVKAADPEAQLLRDAARAALAAGVSDPEALDQVLREVFVTAYGAGGFAASQQLTGTAVVTLEGVSEVDWGAWQPGSPLAAALTRNGGLQAMLERAGITVKSIAASQMDRLATAIADGVRSGASVDTVARGLRDLVTDPRRAEMIAHTETARAMTQATVDTYSVNGVSQFDIVTADNPCDDVCLPAAEAGPYPVAEGGMVPLHPLCRCSIAPTEGSVVGTLSGGGSGALGDLAVDAAYAETSDAAAAEGAADEAASAGAAEDDLTALSDDDLSGMLATDDEAVIDRVVAELERRDAAAAEERRAAEKKAADKARRDARAEAKRAELDAQYDQELDAGADPLEAYARVYGKDYERVRIKAAIAEMRSAGYTGRNFEELCMSRFKEYAERAYFKAEAETRGAVMNKEGWSKGIDPKSLFLGQESRARRYASEELLGFWQQYGRLTLDDFKAAALGQKGRASGTAYFL